MKILLIILTLNLFAGEAEFRTKWTTIKDKRAAMFKCGHSNPNPAIMLNKWISDNSVAKIDALVVCSIAADIEIQEEKDEGIARELDIKNILSKLKDGTITMVQRDRLLRHIVLKLYNEK